MQEQYGMFLPTSTIKINQRWGNIPYWMVCDVAEGSEGFIGIPYHNILSSCMDVRSFPTHIPPNKRLETPDMDHEWMVCSLELISYKALFKGNAQDVC